MRSGESVSVRALVVSRRPLGFEFILGMNGVSALGGVTVSASNHVRFNAETAGAAAAAAAAPVPPETAESGPAAEAGPAARRVPEAAPAAAGAVVAGESTAPAETAESGPAAAAAGPAATDTLTVNETREMAVPEAAAAIWHEEEKDLIVSYNEKEKKWTVQ